MKTPSLRIFRSILRTAILGALLFISASAAPDTKKIYDLPAGDAASTLKKFSEISGQETLFASETVRGVRTQPVKGEYTAKEALDQMLNDTGLSAMRDEHSGAFAISRAKQTEKGRSDPPVGQHPEKRPIRATTSMTQSEAGDEVVRLEKFTVTTELGRYAEEQTTAATKTPMDLKDVPNTIQVLNPSFIGDIRAQALDDLYPYVIGMTRSDTSAAGFTLRGFAEGAATLNNIQVDSLPGLTSRFGSPTTANVDRVEIIKGPTSVMYGLMNPGGIMNIITKSPQAKPGYSLFTSITTYDGAGVNFGEQMSYITNLDLTGPIGGDNSHWLYRIIASYEDLNSYRPGVWQHNYSLFPSLTYRWDSDTELTLKGELIRQSRFSDSGLAAPFNTVALVAPFTTVYQEPTAREVDNGETLAAQFRHNFSNGWVFKFGGRALYHLDGKHAFESIGVTSATPVANSVVTRRYRNQANRRQYDFFDANLYGNVGPDQIRHTLLFGVSGGYEKTDLLRVGFGPAVASVNLYQPVQTVFVYPADGTGRDDPITKFYNTSAYVSDNVKIGSHWWFSGALRYDRQQSDFFNSVKLVGRKQTIQAVKPSGGLVYQPTEAVSLYLSYSSSFLPPLPGNVVDANGNASFPPEAAYQFETGLKASLLNRRMTVLVAVYDIHKTNVVEAAPGVFLPDGTQVSRIVGEQESKGVELSSTYLPMPNWELTTGWTYVDARTIKSPTATLVGSRNTNVPHQSANFWTRYNIPSGALRGLGLGLGAVYVGGRVGATTTDVTKQLPAAGYTRMDTALYYTFNRWSLALNVQNALDRRYIASVPNAFTINPGTPRKITFSARVTF